MVEFKKLMIFNDFKKLAINVSIEDSEEYADYFISNIYVEYYKNANTLGIPSEKAAVAFENDDTTIKEYDDIFDVSELVAKEKSIESFEGGLFYVIVICRDSADEDADIVRDIGSVLDWHKVYELGMQAVVDYNSQCKDCNTNTCERLEQFILVWHSLRFAIEASDMDQANRLWSRFISVGSKLHNGSTCDCR